MTLSEMHLAVLEMMERIRAHHAGLYYGTRRRNASRGADRIRLGCIFLGDEKYIFVPLCPVSAYPNPTTTVGLVFGVDGGAFVSSWIEIVIPTIGGKNKYACPEDNAIYEKFATELKRSGLVEKPEPSKNYIRRKFFLVKDSEKCPDVIAATENWVDKHIDKIVSILGERADGGKLPLVYDQVTMVRSLDSFLHHPAQNEDVKRRLLDLRANVKGVRV